MDNWMQCVDEALRKSGTKADGSPYVRDDVSYLDMLLVKPSAHLDMLTRLDLLLLLFACAWFISALQPLIIALARHFQLPAHGG